MSDMLYAGIDAGGTSTRCVVAGARGVIQGVGRSGPGNALIVGHDAALSAYGAAMDAATAGLAEHPAHLHIAAAGTQIPEGAQGLAKTLSSSNDAQAAFAGALVQGPGIIVIAGTGSAIYGETAAGDGLLIGGWGPLAGDEGSGYAIGRSAIRLLCHAVDGRVPAGVLTNALAEHFATTGRTTLQARLYQPPLAREDVAALAGFVAMSAAAGDAAAQGILDQAAEDLAATVADCAHLLDLHRPQTLHSRPDQPPTQHAQPPAPEHEADARRRAGKLYAAKGSIVHSREGTGIRVATLGGVWNAGNPIVHPFTRRLDDLLPGAIVVPARYAPVIGALLLAYRHAGLTPDEACLAQLSAGAETWGLR